MCVQNDCIWRKHLTRCCTQCINTNETTCLTKKKLRWMHHYIAIRWCTSTLCWCSYTKKTIRELYCCINSDQAYRKKMSIFETTIFDTWARSQLCLSGTQRMNKFRLLSFGIFSRQEVCNKQCRCNSCTHRGNNKTYCNEENKQDYCKPGTIVISSYITLRWSISFFV